MEARCSEISETRPAIRNGESLPGYLVDGSGRVWSLYGQRELGRISSAIGDIPYEFKPYPIGRNGRYLGVALRVRGRTVRTSVHKLIMETFAGPRPDGMEVCHIGRMAMGITIEEIICVMARSQATKKTSGDTVHTKMVIAIHPQN